jgi:hypothetical protein
VIPGGGGGRESAAATIERAITVLPPSHSLPGRRAAAYPASVHPVPDVSAHSVVSLRLCVALSCVAPGLCVSRRRLFGQRARAERTHFGQRASGPGGQSASTRGKRATRARANITRARANINEEANRSDDRLSMEDAFTRRIYPNVFAGKCSSRPPPAKVVHRGHEQHMPRREKKREDPVPLGIRPCPTWSREWITGS